MQKSDIAKPVVALGVTGSIAAYKAADITSKLVQAGVDVHVLMTANACKLVQPHTFLTLSRHPVMTDLWTVPQWQPGHIALADKADLLLIAPATANILGKMAGGIADDVLSTYALSHAGPVVVAPAMNPRMWAHPAVQQNCRILREQGVIFVDPEAGRVACGTGGIGRLAAVESVVQSVLQQLALLQRQACRYRFLITAGPTREALDPVRFISNRSSGKMGYALAQAAALTGGEVTLISGPTELQQPFNCHCVNVQTAAQMAAAVKANFPACDVLIMCAAVADYTPAEVKARKMKKTTGPQNLVLQRTEDILEHVSTLKKPHQKVMGFAAETENLEANAQEKLRRKKLDWLVANDVSRSDIGFESDENEVILFSAAGQEALPCMPKTELAARLIARILIDMDA